MLIFFTLYTENLMILQLMFDDEGFSLKIKDLIFAIFQNLVFSRRYVFRTIFSF